MYSPKTIYRVARTRKELEGAFSLVYKEYLRKGYIPKDYRSRIRISLFNASPLSTTFVAIQGKRVVAGVTLVPDSPLGIPMDKIYKREVDNLREQGRRVAEVSQLAIATDLFGEGFFSMFNFKKLIFVFRLFKCVLDYAMDVEKLTDLCIAINPKQQNLYKFLYFEQFGGLKYYGSVNHAPAVAFRLNLEGAQERARSKKGLYKIFFGEKTNHQLFEKKVKLNQQDLEYLFVKKSEIFEKATKEQLDLIKGSYPLYDIDRMLIKTRY